MRRDDETGRAFDLFFNRVMFPIRDRRGRVISFGGRILGDGQPKYVNGPETALFSKRRTLYALDLAREAVRGGAALVVVEGYMDVIALHQAGFGGAVAPLGTALTEEQLEELWRLVAGADPVLRRRCRRRPGRRARRRTGPAAARARPQPASRPPAGGRGSGHPGPPAGRDGVPGGAGRRHAAGRGAVRPAARGRRRGDAGAARGVRAPGWKPRAGSIADKDARLREYRRALLDRFFAGRADPAADAGRRRAARCAAAGPPARQPAGRHAERARILTAILLRHPVLLHDVEHAYAGLDLPRRSPRLRDAISTWAETAEILDSHALMSHLTHSGLHSET